METGGEDRFERDQQLSVRNPAESMIVSPGAGSAPWREASVPALVVFQEKSLR